MNLFVLNTDPVIAAEMNCDSHVCKIILEALQMMSLAHLEHGSEQPGLWNAHTHRNNHVSKWVRENTSNYRWTAEHALALCSEYTMRYSKVHKCQSMIEWCAANLPPLPVSNMSPFRQAVAEDCYHDDPVIAYHMYYVRYKRSFAKWKLGNTPAWFVDLCNVEDMKVKYAAVAV